MDSDFPYLAVASLSIIAIGCMGNMLSLTLFLRQTSSVNTLLSALSIVDMCLLLFSIPVFVLPNLIVPSAEYYAYVLKFVYPVNLMMQTCSVYIMVLITMERWTAVCRPLQVRIWCTPKTSLRALAGIVVFAVSYNFVRFFEYSIVHENNGTDTGYMKNFRNVETHPNYMIYYYTGLYLLTHFLIPFGVFIIMNGHVCKQIIALRRARLMLTRQQQREQSTTMMLLVVTLTFAICNMLPFLINITECVKSDFFEDEKTAWLAYMLVDLSNLLVMLNSATTFIVYLIFSEKYRQGAIWILTGCCYSYEKDVKYNSLQSRHSLHANSSFYRHSMRESCRIKYSSSQELFLRPLNRAERASSEYNERIKKPQLPAATKSGSEHTTPKTLNALSAANRYKNNRGKDSPGPASAARQMPPNNLKPYRQTSQPTPDGVRPHIIEQRRMSDNPQVLPSISMSRSSSKVPVSVQESPTKKMSSASLYSPPSSYSGGMSPVPSVIVTLLKDSPSTASTEAVGEHLQSPG